MLWARYRHSLFVLTTDFDLKVLALKYEKKIITSEFITFKQNHKKIFSNIFQQKKNYILGGIWVHLVGWIQWDLGPPLQGSRVPQWPWLA